MSGHQPCLKNNGPDRAAPARPVPGCVLGRASAFPLVLFQAQRGLHYIFRSGHDSQTKGLRMRTCAAPSEREKPDRIAGHPARNAAVATASEARRRQLRSVRATNPHTSQADTELPFWFLNALVKFPTSRGCAYSAEMQSQSNVMANIGVNQLEVERLKQQTH